MKGAIVLSTDPDLIAKFDRRLRELGIDHSVGVSELQVRDVATGLGFYFSPMPPGGEIAYTEPPHYPRPGVPMPDLATVHGYGADCRSEAFFVRMVAEIAGTTGQPTWVLDESGVVWDARDVDPERVHL